MKNDEGTVSFDAGDNPKERESVAGKILGIPTAAEFINKNYGSEEQNMINFAKLHVKAALEAASNKIKSDALETYGTDVPDCWSTDSILNAYPDELIK